MGKARSKEIDGGMIRSLVDWLNMDANYNPSPVAEAEAKAVYKLALGEQGQLL